MRNGEDFARRGDTHRPGKAVQAGYANVTETRGQVFKEASSSLTTGEPHRTLGQGSLS